MSLFDKQRKAGTAGLPVEGHLPGFQGATAWLNSTPLTEADLRGKVVLTDFWTYTCINWLRTLGYVRAWAKKYEDQGLVVTKEATEPLRNRGSISSFARPDRPPTGPLTSHSSPPSSRPTCSRSASTMLRSVASFPTRIEAEVVQGLLASAVIESWPIHSRTETNCHDRISLHLVTWEELHERLCHR